MQTLSSKSVRATVGLRVVQMAYSSQNCTELLRLIDPACGPLLRDLDVALTGPYNNLPLFYRNNEDNVQLDQFDDWRTWFAANGGLDQNTISTIHNLNMSGYFYSRSNSACTVHDIALLARMPYLRTMDLSVSGLTSSPRSEVDIETALPTFNEMEDLTIARSSLTFLHTLLRKTGSHFKSLSILGNLKPGSREGSGSADGYEDPGDRASVGSSSRASTSTTYLRPIDVVEVLRNLSSVSQGDRGTLRLDRLAVAPFMQPRHKKHAMRIAQAASLLIHQPYLSLLHTLILDIFIFSSLCAYADMYLGGNPSPATVRNLTLILTRWSLRECDTDIYGEGHTIIDLALGVLAKQIERGDARKLRRIQVTLHDSHSEV